MLIRKEDFMASKRVQKIICLYLVIRINAYGALSCRFCANPATFVWIQRVSVTFFYVVSVLCKSSPFCLDPKGFSDFLLRRVSSVQIQPLLLGPKGFQWLSSTSCQFCANPAPFVWIQRVPVTFFYVVSVLCKSSPFCLDPKGFSAFLTL